MMRKILTILSLLCYVASVPLAGWGQANNPFSPNAGPVQGPDPTGNQGYPISTVPAPGSSAWPTTISGTVTVGGGPFAIGTVSIGNSSTTPLLANATFTGTYENIEQIGAINILISTNVASSTPGGGQIDWSKDGINSAFTEQFNVTSLTGFSRDYAIPVRGGASYFRIRYKNGNTNQGFFRLQTVYRNIPPLIQFAHQFNSNSGIWFAVGTNYSVSPTPILRANYTTSQDAAFSSGAFLINPNYRGVQFVLNVSSVPAVPGGGGLDLQIKTQDASGGITILNASGPKITAIGAYRWVLYPSANNAQTNQGVSMGQIRQIISLPLPSTIGATVTAADAQVYNYQLTMELNQ